jgi:hypothetical protein
MEADIARGSGDNINDQIALLKSINIKLLSKHPLVLFEFPLFLGSSLKLLLTSLLGFYAIALNECVDCGRPLWVGIALFLHFSYFV